MNDESSESMEPMEEVSLTGLGESKFGEIRAWLTERSPKMITETRGGILEGTICSGKTSLTR